ECPGCGKKLKVPDEFIGKTVRCSDCANTFLAQKPPASLPTPPRDDDRDRDEFDEAPRRRRSRRSADGELEAHRGGLVLAFGIISVVLVFLSSGLVIGLVLGILAWIWGSSDLKRMDAGYMDPSGRGNTQAGYICGIIGTILNILVLVLICVVLVI